MAEPLSLTVMASTLVAASGQSAAATVEGLQRVARLTVEVSAFAGTSLVVRLQRRPDTSAQWETTATSATIFTTGAFDLSGPIGPLTRLDWTLTGGAASTTFGVRGTAFTVYAEPADLPRFSVNARGIAELSTRAVVDACIAASDDADGYLGGRYTLPLTEWGDDLRSKCAALATATLFNVRGADPNGPDMIIYDARNQAVTWFNRLQAGRLAPPGIVDSTPDAYEAGVAVRSNTKRGW